MGAAVAALSNAANQNVMIFDHDQDKLDCLPETVNGIIGELREFGLVPTDSGQTGKLEIVRDVEALSECVFVFEAVFEDVAVKQEVYRKLEDVLDVTAVIASNTSNIVPSMLAEGMRYPERLVVVHFWNPPYAVPLVEIVPNAKTAAAVLEAAKTWVKSIGNTPVVLHKEIAGLVGNRLQYAMLREALLLVQQGIATAEEIDEIVTLSIGRRYAAIGPLATADLGGLDTFLMISKQLMPKLANDLEPLELIGGGRCCGAPGGQERRRASAVATRQIKPRA